MWCKKRNNYITYSLSLNIVKIIDVPSQSILLGDFRKIYTVEKMDKNLNPCVLNTEGMKARIKVGPMRGIEGTITRIKGQYSLILNVNFLKRAAAVEIDPSCISLLNWNFSTKYFFWKVVCRNEENGVGLELYKDYSITKEDGFFAKN